MSAETVVKAMISKRINDGKTSPAFYDEVIAVIESDVIELNLIAKALKNKLQEAKEPEEYISYRLDPFATQNHVLMVLLQIARQMKQIQLVDQN
jgi:hypothetical protein